MKRTILLFWFLVSLLTINVALGGDTGTYRILDYEVNLTPRSDGAVNIEYYQKWLVTGGHTPWITVGTPNDNFTIVGYTGAASRMSSASQGGWSGVRLDLDRDYRAGEVFEVFFGIIQRNLFYADQESYRLVFIPGWYDRATTDTLRIFVKLFAKLETVKASPQPSATSEEELTWVKLSLGEGERFSISLSFPRSVFPAGVSRENLKPTPGRIRSIPSLVLTLVISIIVIAIAIYRISRGIRGYSGGRISYGGLFGGGSGRGGSSKSTGGGGGFGGASFSCACACVSCACACACAGGGGAGCSRKLQHSCPFCKPRRRL